MKKDGIQTRNRKVSSKNKKSKKVAVFEPYSDLAQPLPLDAADAASFSLSPGTLLAYGHPPHLLPAASPLHPSPTSLPYSHHLSSGGGMVPTLV